MALRYLESGCRVGCRIFMPRCAPGPWRPRPVVLPHTPVVDATARAEAEHSDRTGECSQYARAMTAPLRKERVWVRPSAICLACQAGRLTSWARRTSMSGTSSDTISESRASCRDSATPARASSSSVSVEPDRAWGPRRARRPSTSEGTTRRRRAGGPVVVHLLCHSSPVGSIFLVARGISIVTEGRLRLTKRVRRYRLSRRSNGLQLGVSWTDTKWRYSLANRSMRRRRVVAGGGVDARRSLRIAGI